MQADDRNVVAAEQKYFPDTRQSTRNATLELQRSDNGYQRNNVDLSADGNGQAVHDRESQRQTDDGAGTLAGLRAQLDGAAEFFDIASNDIHAHAASRKVCGDLRGGEARMEYQI